MRFGAYRAFKLADPTVVPHKTHQLNDARYLIALERLTLEVADRLRVTCAHLSEAELIVLASGMAVIELKYLGRASPTLGERGRPIVARIKDQLLAE